MDHRNAFPSWSMTMKASLLKASCLLAAAAALRLPAHALAQGVPEITPSLKKLLGGLPIADIKDELQGRVGALKKPAAPAISRVAT